MLIKLMFSLCLSMFMASIAFAQDGTYQQVINGGCSDENCSGCQDGACSSGGYDGGSSSCGNNDDWDHDFYNCCRKSIFDYEVCDPCCKKPYVSVFGGATAVEDFQREVLTSSAPFTIETQGANLVDGYGVGGAVGFRVHPLLRLEAEYSYRFNKVGNWSTGVETDGVLTSLTTEAATGRVYSHAGMFNSLFDLSQRRVRCANLYAGGGIGVLTIDAEVATATTDYTSDDSQFAWQLIGGVNYPVNDRVEIFTEYRYLASDNLDVFDATAGADFGDFDYSSHNVFMGLRFNR